MQAVLVHAGSPPRLSIVEMDAETDSDFEADEVKREPPSGDMETRKGEDDVNELSRERGEWERTTLSLPHLPHTNVCTEADYLFPSPRGIVFWITRRDTDSYRLV